MKNLIYFCVPGHTGFLQSTFTTLYILVTNQKHAKKPIVPVKRKKIKTIIMV